MDTAEIITTVEPICVGLVDVLTVNNPIALGTYKAKVEIKSGDTIGKAKKMGDKIHCRPIHYFDD